LVVVRRKSKMEGTVKFFNRTKGFGFVQGDDGKDYFVHSTALAQGVFLRDNDRVSFEPAEGDRGAKAENVQLLEKGSERESEEAPAQETSEESAEEEAQETSEESAEEAPAEEEEAPAEETSEEPAEETPTSEGDEEEKTE
jgi:cold shock protein